MSEREKDELSVVEEHQDGAEKSASVKKEDSSGNKEDYSVKKEDYSVKEEDTPKTKRRKRVQDLEKKQKKLKRHSSDNSGMFTNIQSVQSVNSGIDTVGRLLSGSPKEDNPEMSLSPRSPRENPDKVPIIDFTKISLQRPGIVKRRDTEFDVAKRQLFIDQEDDLPSDSSGQINNLERSISALCDQARSKAEKTSSHSNILKHFNTVSTIFILLAGVVLGVLNIDQERLNDSPGIAYAVSGLGFAITLVQTCITIFSVQKRSVLLREMSYKFRNLYRDTNYLKYSGLRYDEISNKLRELFNRYDKYDLTAFDSSSSGTETNAEDAV